MEDVRLTPLPLRQRVQFPVGQSDLSNCLVPSFLSPPFETPIDLQRFSLFKKKKKTHLSGFHAIKMIEQTDEGIVAYRGTTEQSFDEPVQNGIGNQRHV